MVVEPAPRSIIDLFDLTGRVALVTGGTRGLELQMAMGLAESPVKNVGRRGTPWLFGICKYSHLQGCCLQGAKSLQIRSPVDACRAA
jgi:hypothetical protein